MAICMYFVVFVSWVGLARAPEFIDSSSVVGGAWEESGLKEDALRRVQ